MLDVCQQYHRVGLCGNAKTYIGTSRQAIGMVLERCGLMLPKSHSSPTNWPIQRLVVLLRPGIVLGLRAVA
jgi:hypothetical protein